MDMIELEKMLAHYLQEQVSAIQDAIASADEVKIQQIGHKLKGNSGSIALNKPEINELGLQIETACKDLPKVQNLLVQLNENIQKLVSK